MNERTREPLSVVGLEALGDQVVEKVQAFVDAGAREFVMWFRDYPSDESLTRFAREVIPRVVIRN